MMTSIEGHNENLGSNGDSLTKKKNSVMTVKGLKRRGNEAFINGNMHEAIQAYTAALNIDPLETEVLSNRGAAFIRVHDYQKAKNDLCMCMKLEEEPNVKTITRLAKALWGLQQYDEVLVDLEEIVELNGNNACLTEILDLIETSRSLKKQSTTAEYDMQELVKKQLQNYDCAEYVGPVKIADVTGKGRGLIATEDIQSGQVLVGAKAFAIVFPDSRTQVVPRPKLKVNQEGDSYMEDSRHAKLVTVIADILNANPGARKEFYKLYAGPKLGHVDESDQRQHQAAEGCLTEQDMERINCICYYNGMFSATNPNPRQKPSPGVVDEIRNVNTYGLWVLPSYLNHSCIDINCDVQKYGDFMIIRAMKNISKGEELLTSYTVPTKLYMERKSEIVGYGIQCSCQLCQLEEQESDKVHLKRAELMLLFLNTCITSDSDDPKPIESIKAELEGLRVDHPNLNFSLFWVNRQVGCCRTNIQDYDNAGKSFGASYHLSKFTCLQKEGIRFALQAALCYVNARNKEQARVWMNIVKGELTTTYGTLDVLSALAIQEGVDPNELSQLMCHYSN